MPIRPAPTLPLGPELAATVAQVVHLGTRLRATMTLWARDRITWQSWLAYWNA